VEIGFFDLSCCLGTVKRYEVMTRQKICDVGGREHEWLLLL